MVINVGKFTSFVSSISNMTNYVFNPYQCSEMLISIREMNETVTAPAAPVYADYQGVDRLMMLMNESTQKIEAIKTYRTLTGMGFKESKDAIERYWKPNLVPISNGYP